MNIRETIKAHPVATIVAAAFVMSAIVIGVEQVIITQLASATLSPRYGFELRTRAPHEPGKTFTARFYRSTFPDTARMVEYATAGPVLSDSTVTFRDTIPYETRWYYAAKVDRLPFRSVAQDRSGFSKLLSVLAVDFRQGQRVATTITLYDSLSLSPPNLRKEMICVDVPCIQWIIARSKAARLETITGSCPYFDRRPPFCKTTLSDMVAIMGDLAHSPSLLVWFTRQYARAACDTFSIVR